MYLLLEAIPFVGALLSLSLVPLVAPKIWHSYENYFLLFWIFLSLSLVFFNADGTLFKVMHTLFHTIWHEYLPFVLLIFALFTITGGIHININAKGTPLANVCLLAIASFMASFVGTTGASILFIRPLLKINAQRKYKTHTVIFFIFLVSNIAGCLTPLGDPPLFLGYLMDVPFLWPLKNLWQPFLFIFISVLFIYGIFDCYLFKREIKNKTKKDCLLLKIGIEGKRNILLLVLIICSIVMTPSLPIIEFIGPFDVHFTSTDFLRIFIFIIIGFLSYKITPHFIHKKQDFTFKPISEIARVFLCIFITLSPVSKMLTTGKNGPFSALLALMDTHDPAQNYFWLTGLFSSFLDNAPTYIVFFELAGGNPAVLTTGSSSILVAISLGSVFMGALTYIGNAPNFMIKSIVKQNSVQMPSFFGYMLWSVIILLPLFYIMSLIWL